MQKKWFKRFVTVCTVVGMLSSSLSVFAAETYTVQSGDNLGKIAKKVYGDSSRWKEIYDANKDTIKNPSVIYKGQVFTIPATGDAVQNPVESAAEVVAPVTENADTAAQTAESTATDTTAQAADSTVAATTVVTASNGALTYPTGNVYADQIIEAFRITPSVRNAETARIEAEKVAAWKSTGASLSGSASDRGNYSDDVLGFIDGITDDFFIKNRIAGWLPEFDSELPGFNGVPADFAGFKTVVLAEACTYTDIYPPQLLVYVFETDNPQALLNVLNERYVLNYDSNREPADIAFYDVVGNYVLYGMVPKNGSLHPEYYW